VAQPPAYTLNTYQFPEDILPQYRPLHGSSSIPIEALIEPWPLEVYARRVPNAPPSKITRPRHIRTIFDLEAFKAFYVEVKLLGAHLSFFLYTSDDPSFSLPVLSLCRVHPGDLPQ
jgi:hypothetical protein